MIRSVIILISIYKTFGLILPTKWLFFLAFEVLIILTSRVSDWEILEIGKMFLNTIFMITIVITTCLYLQWEDDLPKDSMTVDLILFGVIGVASTISYHLEIN